MTRMLTDTSNIPVRNYSGRILLLELLFNIAPETVLLTYIPQMWQCGHDEWLTLT